MKNVGLIELGKLLKLTEVVSNKGIEEVQNIVAIVGRYWTEKKRRMRKSNGLYHVLDLSVKPFLLINDNLWISPSYTIKLNITIIGWHFISYF